MRTGTDLWERGSERRDRLRKRETGTARSLLAPKQAPLALSHSLPSLPSLPELLCQGDRTRDELGILHSVSLEGRLHFRGGRSAKHGRSSAISYQEALSEVQIWAAGRTPGSPSIEPARRMI